MRKLVFHMGIPKTGSTALQVFLARNAATLKDKSCEYFEIGEASLGRIGRISSGNGAYLARSLLAFGNPARMPDSQAPIAEFLRSVETSSCTTGIVSSELFVDARTEDIAGLLTSLTELDVTPQVFYFVREQDQFLSSSYVQQVKRHGLTITPDEFASKTYRHIAYLRYSSWFSYLTSLFGRENVLCRTYEGAMHSEHGIFGTFCNTAGIDLNGLDFNVSDVNTGMSVKELQIMRILNRYKPRMKFSDLVVENSQLAGEAQSGATYGLFSKEVQSDILTFFKAENEAFARSYFNRDELFFVRMKAASEAINSDMQVNVSDVVAFTGGLLVRYDERLANLEGRLGAAESRIGALERKA